MDGATEFEELRPVMFGLAYRLLGSAAEAEDAVQDAYLKWAGAERGSIESPRAWLAKVVTNLCLNRLTSARVQRERYVGPWLPEPVLTSDDTLGPLETAEQRDSVSLAMLVLLEQLSPVERAVFVLKEAFAYSHREIAAILDVSEVNSRQLHSRARRDLARPDERRVSDPSQLEKLVESFLSAARDGDLPALESLFTAEVTAWSDGGGKASAGRRPVHGAAKVARLYAGMFARATQVSIEIIEVNGGPAVIATVGDALYGILGFEVVDGRISGLRAVANPDKLAFASRQLSRSGWPAGS
ncbi:RNA polymerase sigma-70 factor [Amycolatopsis sp. BJA-103]|uniref:RNA polymerase sigma-70 factor n=1 Tax=Amycolatopsis sp. BJA-103 TaxID=1911175 RepID=UPI000C762C97|nr:RNA polymerase sigma-70 factor [Amycolatopsis sp. BJA-103]AUI59093.1 RNA polymerase subunit sigma-24 [Amycolatopsis sp. BJA-103]PNE17459.1 RNA polymerase subunit sigma-24 [Amycolatopsis sp. BJA-103]